MFSSVRLSLLNRARRCSHPVLQQLYRSQAALLQQPIANCRFLSADLEMTGLDTAKDHILSIGWVPVDGREIILRESAHFLLSSSRAVGQSATIHGIRDQDIELGHAAGEIFEQFLAAAQNRLLIFHHAPLDLRFLNKLSLGLHQQHFKPAVVDTLHLRAKTLRKMDRPPADGELRLGACRQHYRLPHYGGHNALSDALATAELFLAMTTEQLDQPVKSIVS